MGLTAKPEELHTSALAVIDHLRTQHPDFRRLFVLGTPSMLAQFRDAGFLLMEDRDEDVPDAVGFDLPLAYAHLFRAAWWARQGKPYFATNPDFVCPTDQPTVLVDCGAICASIQAATGRAPDLVFGKPAPSMLDGILRRHRVAPEAVAVVGDRIYTDIAMARRARALGVLVLTGEATDDDTCRAQPPPDLVVPRLAEFGELLAEARQAVPFRP